MAADQAGNLRPRPEASSGTLPKANPPRRGRYLGSIVFLIALSACPCRVGLAVEDPSVGCRIEPTGASPVIEPRAVGRFHHVALRGDVPIQDFPDIQRKADAIWSILAHRFRLSNLHAAPQIHFHPFDREKQSGDWTAWQKAWTRDHPAIWHDWTALREKGSIVEISQDWIDRNIDDIFPFPDSFLAFHYDGTNRIQINPDRTFRASMQRDPYGDRRDIDGRGYYIMGHEMLHYALELAGVAPTKLHHCLMLYPVDDQGEPGMMAQVAQHMVEDGIIAASSRLHHVRAERVLAPCSRLTADELRLVESFHARFGAAGQHRRPSGSRFRRLGD